MAFLAMILPSIFLSAEERPAAQTSPLQPWGYGESLYASHDYSPEAYRLYAASVTIPSTVFAHSALRVDYLIPVDNANRPIKKAADLVAVFPTPGGLGIESWVARELASRYGFSVYSVYFPNHNKANQDDKSKYWIFPNAGATQAWLTAAAAVRIESGIPTRRLFVAGYSCGGSAAQLFASSCQDRIEAGVFISGRTFELTEPFLGPALIMRSDQDREASNLELINEMKGAKIPPIHLTFPPNWRERGKNDYWKHNVDHTAWELAASWIAAIANLRGANKGVVPPRSGWFSDRNSFWPTKEVAAKAMMLPPTPIETSSATGDLLVEVRPATTKDLKGTICWIDRRFICSDDDLTAMGQMCSASGHSFIGSGRSNGHSGKSPRDLLDLTKDAARFPTPKRICIVNPKTEDIDSIAVSPRLWDRVYLFDPKPTVMSDVVTKLRPIAGKVYIAVDKATHNSIVNSLNGEKSFKLIAPSEVITLGESYAFWITAITQAP